MFVSRRILGRISLVSLAALAACATPPPPPPPPTPPPPVVPTVMPTPPDNAAAGMAIPEKDENGKFLTANRGTTANTALWHVRMALNVAALNCDKFGSTARNQYNQLLSVHRNVLSSANAAVDRNYKAAYGNAALQSRERLNTIVYNFFALPPVIKNFCPVAVTVGAKMLLMPSSQLLVEAPALLAELEKPFQEFYAAYEDYLRRLAEWQARFGSRVTVIISGQTMPTPPKPPAEVPAGWTPGMPTSLPATPTVPVTTPATTPSGPPTPARTLPDNSAPKLVVQPLPAGDE